MLKPFNYNTQSRHYSSANSLLMRRLIRAINKSCNGKHMSKVEDGTIVVLEPEDYKRFVSLVQIMNRIGDLVGYGRIDLNGRFYSHWNSVYVRSK